MALTGKTIGQLTYLQFPTNDTLIPVEYLGDTFHITFSSITYTEGTHAQFLSDATNGVLTPGKFYLMTDYQACYDQPNFDYNGNPILTGNYKSGATEPLLLLAIATDRFSPTVYSPSHPYDKITYDITWVTTEVTGNPAKGRITERTDEFNNRTDYDHRSILFKRYKSYFQDGNINGRIIEMNSGLVTGLDTNFTSDLTTGDTIWIMSQFPQQYEVISVESTTGMTVAGFNYQNFTDPVGFYCQKMFTIDQEGVLYYFNDVGNDNINDGGDDMYDGGNGIFTNLFNDIPYTHTQMTNPPINGSIEASYGDFTYDGTVESGDTYFNSGSTYFTNCYPGLFVMSAYDVDISDFEIDGNLGSDGDGQADTYDYTLTYGGNDYSVYCKRVWGAGDPSVNHIFIVNTIDENITHNIDTSTEDDLDTISNLSGITQIHYLLFALSQGAKPTDTQIENVVNSYLSLISTTDINVTLSNLNLDFTGVTSNLPQPGSYKALNYKQTNLTGDTESFQEYLTFGEPSNLVVNNYIGNYANTKDWDNNNFILSNNVFYGNGNISYVNNTFGNSCFNNTFDDDCTNNIIGNFFYNNTTDDDFDDNIISNNFYNNYITANFQRNRIGDQFNNNTIINGSFYRNDIGNEFNQNVVTNGDFQNNEIGNAYNNNIINSAFYKNDIGNGYNNNKTYSNFYGNLIGGGYNNNKNYNTVSENVIGEVFDGNTMGNSSSFGSSNFNRNTIGNYFQNNTIPFDFSNNEIMNYFEMNNFSGYCSQNKIQSYCQNNNFSGVIAYNQIGNNFQTNNIGDGFGFGFSTSQGNVIGNYFYNNTIGEYFYNNVIADGFYSNTVVDYFQLNNVKFSLSSTDFTTSTHVYGNYNCELFINSTLAQRLSYYDGSDVLTIVNINS